MKTYNITIRLNEQEQKALKLFMRYYYGGNARNYKWCLKELCMIGLHDFVGTNTGNPASKITQAINEEIRERLSHECNLEIHKDEPFAQDIRDLLQVVEELEKELLVKVISHGQLPI